MATRTFTWAGGGTDHKWSTAANWDTPPVDNDTVVIAASSECQFDVDMTSLVTYPNGIAGLTITSHATTPAMLYFDTAASTKFLRIKTGTTINGTNAAVKGRLLINSDGVWATDTRHPFTSKCTIEFITTAYCDLTYLNSKILCYEPTTTSIVLRNNEAIAQTELDVTGDMTAVTGWEAGALVSICDLQQAQEQETREIAAGGVAATTLTLTTGLTAAKVAGTYPAIISLVTRNVKIIGGSGSTQKCWANGTSDRVDAWMYCATASQGYAFSSCTGLTIGGGCIGPGAIGQNNGWTRVGSSSTLTISSGTQSGNSSVGTTCTITISGGTQSGNTYVGSGSTFTISGGTQSGNASVGTSCTITISGGTQSGNTSVGSGSTFTISGGTQSGNTYVGTTSTFTISGGTQSGNTYVGSSSTITISGGTQSGNTYAVRRCPQARMLGNTISGGTEVYEYETGWVPDDAYVQWIGVNGVATAEKDWSKGGVTISTVTGGEFPSGYTQGYKMTCASATKLAFWQVELTLAPGETGSFIGQIRIADDHSAYAPRLEIIDVANDPLNKPGASPLDTSSVATPGGSANWQAVDVSYTNAGTLPMPIKLRVYAMRATGDVYFAVAFSPDYPSVTSVLDTDTVNRVAGTYHAPDAAEVIDTAVFGPASAVSGTVHQPGAAEVIDTAVFGPASAVTGTVHQPDAAEVLNTATFGPGSAITGTFNEAARNTDPGVSAVLWGTTYKICNVDKTGTSMPTLLSGGSVMLTGTIERGIVQGSQA